MIYFIAVVLAVSHAGAGYVGYRYGSRIQQTGSNVAAAVKKS